MVTIRVDLGMNKTMSASKLEDVRNFVRQAIAMYNYSQTSIMSSGNSQMTTQ